MEVLPGRSVMQRSNPSSEVKGITSFSLYAFSHVFLASLKSACFGLNLTAANKVIMIDGII
jgi:hypothetical protein